jgi:uncharacterized ubiquitin-like protein YukD
VQESDTIELLKRKVKELKGIEPENMKLVHKGKMHPDEKTLGEAQVKDGDFLVITIKKGAEVPA